MAQRIFYELFVIKLTRFIFRVAPLLSSELRPRAPRRRPPRSYGIAAAPCSRLTVLAFWRGLRGFAFMRIFFDLVSCSTCSGVNSSAARTYD
jgi:hypothetical protein